MNESGVLDSLDREIAGALQVNGRAGWRRIAAALEVPERTVAARGAELLRSGTVRMTTLTLLPRGGVLESLLVTMRCTTGMSRVATASIAARPNVVFTFLTTGDVDGVFELMDARSRSMRTILDEIPGTPGVSAFETSTVLTLYKATHQWLPSILTPDQIAALYDPDRSWKPTGAIELPPLGRDELVITRALAADGRASIEDLARLTGLSAASTRRRLALLHEQGRIFERAVVEPSTLGFPVEAILRIRTSPGHIAAVAERLLEVPEVRYLAFVTGRYQLIVNVACTSHDALATLLMRSDWTADAVEVNTSMVLTALKRSGIRLRDDDA